MQVQTKVKALSRFRKAASTIAAQLSVVKQFKRSGKCDVKYYAILHTHNFLQYNTIQCNTIQAYVSID